MIRVPPCPFYPEEEADKGMSVLFTWDKPFGLCVPFIRPCDAKRNDTNQDKAEEAMQETTVSLTSQLCLFKVCMTFKMQSGLELAVSKKPAKMKWTLKAPA